MKAEDAGGAIFEVALQRISDAAESDIRPWNLTRIEELYLQAFFSGGVFRGGEMGSVEKVDLVDMGNADHGKRGVNDDIGARFLGGFTYGGRGSGFTIFHEAGR